MYTRRPIRMGTTPDFGNRNKPSKEHSVNVFIDRIINFSKNEYLEIEKKRDPDFEKEGRGILPDHLSVSASLYNDTALPMFLFVVIDTLTKLGSELYEKDMESTSWDDIGPESSFEEVLKISEDARQRQQESQKLNVALYTANPDVLRSYLKEEGVYSACLSIHAHEDYLLQLLRNTLEEMIDSKILICPESTLRRTQSEILETARSLAQQLWYKDIYNHTNLLIALKRGKSWEGLEQLIKDESIDPREIELVSRIDKLNITK